MSSDSKDSKEKDSTSSSPKEGRASTIRCSFCREDILHAPFRVPLGPIKWRVDEEASKAGIEVKQGFVDEAKACVKCARAYAAKVNEDYLILPPAIGKAYIGPLHIQQIRIGFWRRLFGMTHYRCPICNDEFAMRKNREPSPFVCPSCITLVGVPKDE